MSPRFSSLSVAQQNALFELLVIATQADGSIRLTEQEQALALLDSMGFPTEYERDFYVHAVFTRVARLDGAIDARRERLTTLCAQFDTREKRRLAAHAVEDVLAADRDADPAEVALRADLRSLLDA